MSKYDPTFWEIFADLITGQEDALETMLVAPDFLAELFITPEDEQAVQEKEQLKQDAVEQIRELIRTRLTPRQQQVVEMYFYQNQTQQEIAQALDISQQVVSKHLFGALRDGRRVGGALAKLRKSAEKLGIDPEKWV